MIEKGPGWLKSRPVLFCIASMTEFGAKSSTFLAKQQFGALLVSPNHVGFSWSFERLT